MVGVFVEGGGARDLWSGSDRGGCGRGRRAVAVEPGWKFQRKFLVIGG